MLLDISGASRDRSNHLHVDFLPVRLKPLIVNHHQTVQVRLFDSSSNHTSSKNGTWGVMTARSQTPSVAVPVEALPTRRVVPRLTLTPRTGLHNSSDLVVMLLDSERLGYFRVLGKELGHCLLVLKFYEFRKPGNTVYFDKDGGSEELGEIELRLIVSYRVSVVRRIRSVDQAFNWVVAIVTMVNSFSLGCVTEWTVVKKELRRKYIVVFTALVCQFVVLPVVSVALYCIVLLLYCSYCFVLYCIIIAF